MQFSSEVWASERSATTASDALIAGGREFKANASFVDVAYTRDVRESKSRRRTGNGRAQTSRAGRELKVVRVSSQLEINLFMPEMT